VVKNQEGVLPQDAIPSKLRNQVDRLLPLAYCPEVDVSLLLDAAMTTRFQKVDCGAWKDCHHD